jgi:enoyl-[acyl-carrier protein] reductase II
MNKVCDLFQIKYPVIQAGMIWNSGWRLASAAANAGCLGLIGAGSMYPDILKENIQKCKAATNKPFGVNVPMIYPDIDKVIQIIIDEKVKIVFSSAGNPATWTKYLKEKGITVVHVVSNLKFAQKAEDSGVDAIVGEGFEAGGHNGREETTTMCLIPLLKDNLKIPIIAAGGIASGASMLAAMALGADGVQVGSRFAASVESSSHANFKNAIINAKDGDTHLMLKKLQPVRLLKNKFFNDVKAAEEHCATEDELKHLLGRARSKHGMFEGDLEEGELEIGQIASTIKSIKTVQEIVDEIIRDYTTLVSKGFEMF